MCKDFTLHYMCIYILMWINEFLVAARAIFRDDFKIVVVSAPMHKDQYKEARILIEKFTNEDEGAITVNVGR